MKTLSVDYSKAIAFCEEEKLESMIAKSKEALKQLDSNTGLGSDFTGWNTLPEDYDKEEFNRIQEAAQKIKSQSEILIVIGIGGSYLGAKAAIHYLTHNFHNEIDSSKRSGVRVYFAGINISASYLRDLMDLVKNQDFSINVISKSGTTTEPAIAFRVLKKMLIDKYGEEASRDRIYVTTDRERGALKQLSDREGYPTFVVPDNIGGRFSVLTAVGLLPIAAAGLDIDALMKGAQEARRDANNRYEDNPTLQYAVIRNLLYGNDKKIEILVSYEPQCLFIAEWWKQLYGESEGKEGKGLFPASVTFTADLHSMGQYIQDGERHIFETVLNVKQAGEEILVPVDLADLDGLNYLAGKGLNYINQKAKEGTMIAHLEGRVPNVEINIKDFSEHSLGYLFYFYEKACAVSGYMLGVNPFDQPGVEDYKRNVFKLLGKPGYE